MWKINLSNINNIVKLSNIESDTTSVDGDSFFRIDKICFTNVHQPIFRRRTKQFSFFYHFEILKTSQILSCIGLQVFKYDPV